MRRGGRIRNAVKRLLARARATPRPPRRPRNFHELRSAYEANSPGGAVVWRRAVSTFVEARLPYEEYVLELALLGLKGQPYAGEAYARALGERLSLDVEIASLADAAFLASGDGRNPLGRLVHVPERRGVRVELPARLSPWLRQHTLFHELGHLAAGHPPVAEYGQLVDAGQPPWRPLRRLARRPPVIVGLPPDALGDLYEAEAELRAEYALLTGALGPAALETARLSQIL